MNWKWWKKKSLLEENLETVMERNRDLMQLVESLGNHIRTLESHINLPSSMSQGLNQYGQTWGGNSGILGGGLHAQAQALQSQQQAMAQQQQQQMDASNAYSSIFGQLIYNSEPCKCSHHEGEQREVEELLGTWKECTCGKCLTKTVFLPIGYAAKLEKIQDLLASGLITAQAAREMLKG